MRSREISASEAAPKMSVPLDNKAKGVKQREVRFSDFEAVAKLKCESGLSSDSLANWYRFWRDNAALSFAKGPLPMGWVLAVDDKVVGYLGSIPLLYHYGSRPLLAATASGFAVQPDYRAFSVGLVASFYRQENIDLFLNTTAIESVGKLAKAFKADALPQEDYDTVLFWVLDIRQFLDAVAKKFGVTGNWATVGRIVASIALQTEKTVWRKLPGRSSDKFQVTECHVSEIGDNFEKIWRRKLEGKPRLFADRDQSHLRWHFTIPDTQQVTRAFFCQGENGFTGYAIVRIESEPETGLRRCWLADILVDDDNPEVISALITRACNVAEESDCHVFEVLGFPKNLRQVLLQWRPYTRRYPACPFYFKAKDHELHRVLQETESWYASPFDGDTTLMP